MRNLVNPYYSKITIAGKNNNNNNNNTFKNLLNPSKNSQSLWNLSCDQLPLSIAAQFSIRESQIGVWEAMNTGSLFPLLSIWVTESPQEGKHIAISYHPKQQLYSRQELLRGLGSFPPSSPNR